MEKFVAAEFDVLMAPACKCMPDRVGHYASPDDFKFSENKASNSVMKMG
jgi:hypothetical protein